MSINKIEGTLVFIQVDTPRKCFLEEKGSEWKASILVTEDFADEWDAAYPKQPAKQVKTTDFEEIYKIPAPYQGQRKQYIVTLRKNTKLGDGRPVPEIYQPRVFEQLEDGSRVNITTTKLVANGSIGAISIDNYDGKIGTFARLKNVLVTELIEYVKAPSTASEPGSEFGDAPKAAPTSTPAKPAAKAVAKPKAVAEDLDDSGAPF